MNILYILHSTYPLGGASKSFLTLIKGVQEQGHTPIVVTPDEKGVAITLQQMGVEVKTVPFRTNTYPDMRNTKEAILFLPRLVARRILIHKAVNTIYNLVKSRKIAMVHSNVSVVDVGERVAKRLGIPHIYHIREYADIDFGLHYFPTSKQFHKQLAANYTICITKAIQQHHHLGDNPKSIVVYNGIVMEKEQDVEPLPTTPYLLYAGRIEETKGLMDLVIAYTRFAERNRTACCSLAVAGEVTDAIYYQKVTQYLEDKGVKNKVTFLGPRKDIHHLMRHAISTIVPSRFEGFGRCLPEAMFCSCITIGRDTAGTKEQYDNGLQLTGKEIGFRFHDVEELALCLENLYSASSQELQALRDRALRTVSEYYTQQRYINNIIQFYERIERERSH